MKYQNIREEEIKNKVGQDFFQDFDTSTILKSIDFCVKPKNSPLQRRGAGGEVLPNQKTLFEDHHLLWAEAKTGDFDTIAMFAQLIITIGKERTFDKHMPPAFLGAFDGKKIVFVAYNTVIDIFAMNDFNWKVTPSNHETKEFEIIKKRIEKALETHHYYYDFEKDEKELQFFIKNNLRLATEQGKITIDKNNFVPIYLRWLDHIKPIIDFNWEAGKKQNILDNSFYLADLFVDDKGTTSIDDDETISENLFVVFRSGHYEIAKDNIKSLFDATIKIKDKKVYEQFWKKYKRPPLEEFQQEIINRKDLLVPQDIRERKGAFFTPKKWVELSQKYITDVLGEDWQDNYFVWDCAAGTGNLLAGLTNKFHIFASTLDQSDVNAMHERIENGAILLKDHVFQFDFLNDEFIPISKGGKMPDMLFNIINNEEKRKKLVVYINPPYAEAATYGEGENKRQVTAEHKTSIKYKEILGRSVNELFANFFFRIQDEIQYCTLASFSTLKYINSQNFDKFRNNFKGKFLKGFISPSNTFDNVKGKFPIGFLIWKLDKKTTISEVKCDVYDNEHRTIKNFFSIEKNRYIINWIRGYFDKKNERIGFLRFQGTDFQTNNHVFLTLAPTPNDIKESKTTFLTKENLIQISIYLTIRQVFDATWLNDRDQFLYPNDGWQTDIEFQNDCLAFALFHGQNRISSKEGVNHWIPFTEQEVDARTKFESNFMTDFMKSKASPNPSKGGKQQQLFEVQAPLSSGEGLGVRSFSPTAKTVFDAGRELWKYYHKSPQAGETYNVNASLYDIREYFQGRNAAGKMNLKSEDKNYTVLITALRDALKVLAKKIGPKVYEFGFLKA
jgi:hypothetical protein